MNAAAQPVTDPQAAKVGIVLAALARDEDLTRAERALLDELENVPAVKTAREAYSRRMEEAACREEEARIAGLRAAEAELEAEREAEVSTRRAEWKAADPLVRALHLLAKELRPDRFGERLLRLAEMIENPSITLRKPGGVYSWGEKFPACDRPPPATFHPIALGLDPEDADGR